VKISYGTYGMPTESMETAVPLLAQMGYDGIELCVADRFPTAPGKLDPKARAALAALLADQGVTLNALMMLSNVMADEAGHEQNLRDLGDACTLAHDLAMAEPCVISVTCGGKPEPWDDTKDTLVARLREWAAIAGREGCVVALEPHVGAILDRPERGAWAVNEVGSPALRLNFDISHFDIQGYAVPYTVALLAPLAVHAHVKDGRMVDGKVQFLLPGEGEFDYVAYLKSMVRAGYDGYITVEISGQLSGREGYDPYAAAQFSYRTLSHACVEAGLR